ncbi:aldehyde dehydrogenase [Amorphus sp. MBR-141]
METLLVIDNVARPASSGHTYEHRNAVSGDVVTRAASAGADDATLAADSAHAAFAAWSRTGPTERRRILLAAADCLEAKTAEFISVMASEIGASQLWAGFNVMLAANLFREAASLATQIQGETIPTDKPGTLSMTVRQPVGAVLSIVPWNGPVVLAARAIAYPIVCGNTVVFRASESSPRTHMLVAEALYEAGLPAGVLNVVTNAPAQAEEVVDTLIAHPAIRRVNFTGSTRVGRIIAEKAGRHLKRCLLELGGKSPMVVLEDADLDGAVRAATFGAFLYQGQICMTTGRIVVDERIADDFVARLAARAAELSVGDPTIRGDCVIGPLIGSGAGERIHALIEDAVAKGATVVTGGGSSGAQMSATIVDHVTAAMRIYDEETFGPCTVVVRAKDTEDAIRIANDTEYGLSAAVFGRDVTRALDAAMRIDAGCCHVNGSTVQNEAQAPYGGMKASGYGRFDGRAVIDEFTELKWVTIEPADQAYPF